MRCLVVGCGLTGSVIARELAERGTQIEIWERRDHIGGNMYDYVDEHGFLVQKYGPHAFHTTKKELYDYICRFEQWQEYHLTCGAVWDNKYTPTPFNFTTIDTFYPPEEAERLKEKLKKAFAGRETATVVEVLEHPDQDIRGYAEYLFQKDYAPYTAKQWDVSPEEIDPSVLKRVPLRFSYGEGYFDDEYQVLPRNSYTAFFENLLNHPNISVKLGVEALEHLAVRDDVLYLDGKPVEHPVVYTGALDELFGCVYERLPYRSLRFEWKHTDEASIQEAPIVAYPHEKGYTRITEYKKLPAQDKPGSSYAVEYPLPYREGEKMEPYYPVLTKESQEQYAKYAALAQRVPNLICCGRLAEFKYYNMDQALERGINISTNLIGGGGGPSVKIVTSVFNGEKYIQDAINSVLHQTYSNLELWIRDNCSTDHTLEILQNLTHDGKVHIIKGEKNIGFINGYFETLVACGDADYYAYLDCDDTWPENKIEIAIKALEKEKHDIPILWCSKYTVCNEELIPLYLSPNVHQVSFRNSLVDIVGIASTYVFNANARKLLLKNLPQHAVGQDMWMYVLCQGLGKVLFDSRPLMNYRRHSGNISAATDNRMKFLMWRIKHFLVEGAIENIRDQIEEYSDLYVDQLNDEDRRTLELFTKRNIVTTIKKLFYPHMFRQNLPDEIMLRGMFLLGLL